jgi:hypothetical protein
MDLSGNDLEPMEWAIELIEKLHLWGLQSSVMDVCSVAHSMGSETIYNLTRGSGAKEQRLHTLALC